MYTAWARTGARWKAVAEGDTLDGAHRRLLAWVRQRPRPPAASAVLPRGAHPDQAGGAPHRLSDRGMSRAK
jgi:hypothetical protein